MKLEKSLIYAVLISFILNLYGNPAVRFTGMIGKYILVVLFFMCILLRYRKNGEEKKVIKHDMRIIIPLGAMLFFLFTSAFISTNILKALSNFFSFLALLGFLYLFARIFKMYEEENAFYEIATVFLNVILFSFVLGAAMILLLKMNLVEAEFTGGRYRSGFGGFLEDRMAFGFLSLLGFSLSVFLYQRMRYFNRKKVCYLSLIVLFFGCALLSNTRTSFLFLALFILLLMKYHVFDRIYWPPRYSLIISGTLVLLILAIVFVPSYTDLITERDFLIQFSTGRVLIWYLAFKLLFEGNLFFGMGFKMCGSLILENFMKLAPYFEQVKELSLHSSYVEILASSGIFGLISFVILAVVLIYKMTDKYIKTFVISFLTISLITSLVVIPNSPISAFFWATIFYSAIELKSVSDHEDIP